MEAVCEVLEGIPGKKSVIQFTSGVTQPARRIAHNSSPLPTPRIAPTFPSTRWIRAACSLQHREADASTGASGGTAMFSGATVISQSQSRQDSRETLATLAGDTGGVRFSTSATSLKSSKTCRATMPVTTSWAITARTRRGMGAGGAFT